MATRIQSRRDTTVNWSTLNPILADGEIGIEKTNPPKVKIGDGVTHWNSLPYVTTSGGGGTWGSITGTLTDQTDLTSALSTKVDNSMIDTTFTNSILLDKIAGRNYGVNDVTSNITISLDSTNIKDGGNAQIGLRGNGTNTPVLTAFNKYDSSGLDYNLTLNTVNSFAFFRWLGKVYYNILDQYISTGPLTLSAPGSFTATSNTATSISLSWTVVANASSYKLEWSANGTTGWTQIGGTLAQSATSYSHTSLTASTLYYYRISSIGDGINYLTSGFATSNTTVLTPTTLTAPTVTGSALGQTSLRFSWSNITNNSGYRYKISTDNGSTFGTPVDVVANTTSFDITGLTTGTRRDVQILTLGDGVTYLNSAYSTTANSTTSSLTQLSTPTLNAPTVVSSTQINLGWSTVANVTSWKLETSSNGTTGWSQIGGTIAAGTLSYNHTSLTANTAYYYRLTAVGNGTVYSDSNASSNVNATTKTAAPTLVSSATSTNGLTITHTFSRAMAASPTTTGYSTSPSKTISSATRNADPTKIDVVVSVAFASGNIITATIPQWSPADGGDNFAGVTGTSVTNNVPANTYYRLNTYGTENFVYDAFSSANFTFSGSDIQTIKDGSGNSRDLTLSTPYPSTYDNSNKALVYHISQLSQYGLASSLNIGTVHSIIIIRNYGSDVDQIDIVGVPLASYISGKIEGTAFYVLDIGVYQYVTNTNTGKQIIIITRNGSTVKTYLNGTLATNLGNTIPSGTSFVMSSIGGLNAYDSKGNLYYMGSVNVELNQTQINTIVADLNTRYP